MPFARVVPVVDPKVRGLCVKPYPRHPRGCPNFGSKAGCPPLAPQLADYFDLSQPTYAVWNDFPIGEHVRAMQVAHPTWSDAQLYCCLYWQPRARTQLKIEVMQFTKWWTCQPDNYDQVVEVNRCPEAMGLDVTATMKSIGVVLEWPPRELAVQVALAGTLKRKP